MSKWNKTICIPQSNKWKSFFDDVIKKWELVSWTGTGEITATKCGRKMWFVPVRNISWSGYTHGHKNDYEFYVRFEKKAV